MSCDHVVDNQGMCCVCGLPMALVEDPTILEALVAAHDHLLASGETTTQTYKLVTKVLDRYQPESK